MKSRAKEKGKASGSGSSKSPPYGGDLLMDHGSGTSSGSGERVHVLSLKKEERSKKSPHATTGEAPSATATTINKKKKQKNKEQRIKTSGKDGHHHHHLLDVQSRTPTPRKTESPSYNRKTPSTRKLIAKALQGGNGGAPSGGNTILRPALNFESSSESESDSEGENESGSTEGCTSSSASSVSTSAQSNTLRSSSSASIIPLSCPVSSSPVGHSFGSLSSPASASPSSSAAVRKQKKSTLSSSSSALYASSTSAGFPSLSTRPTARSSPSVTHASISRSREARPLLSKPLSTSASSSARLEAIVGRSRAASLATWHSHSSAFDAADLPRPYTKGIMEEVERDILLADLSEWVQNKNPTKASDEEKDEEAGNQQLPHEKSSEEVPLPSDGQLSPKAQIKLAKDEVEAVADHVSPRERRTSVRKREKHSTKKKAKGNIEKREKNLSSSSEGYDSDKVSAADLLRRYFPQSTQGVKEETEAEETGRNDNDTDGKEPPSSKKRYSMSKPSKQSRSTKGLRNSAEIKKSEHMPFGRERRTTMTFPRELASDGKASQKKEKKDKKLTRKRSKDDQDKAAKSEKRSAKQSATSTDSIGKTKKTREKRTSRKSACSIAIGSSQSVTKPPKEKRAKSKRAKRMTVDYSTVAPPQHSPSDGSVLNGASAHRERWVDGESLRTSVSAVVI